MEFINDIVTSLDQICEQIVQLVTFGQLQALKDMYLQWYQATGGVSQPNILGYAFALFVVIVRFAVPIVLFYYLVVNKLVRNTIIKLVIISVFSIAYALFYFDPIRVFEDSALAVTNFYHFLMDLPSMEYEPFIFVFLTNGAVIFTLRVIFVSIMIWLMFAVFLGLFTILVWLFSGGRSIWDYSDKSFKPIVTQMTVVFLVFYPIFGAFKTFLTVIALTISAINIKDALYTMAGYQKVCYNVGESVKCKWVK